MNAVEIYEKASWGVDHSKITLGEFEERIKPLYDVEPVRHGKWSHDYIKDGMEYIDWFNLHCSICGQTQLSTFGKWDYCPYCGAKMDEEEQENEGSNK